MTTTREDIVALMRDDKRYRERRGRWERALIAFVVSLILAPLNGWMLMLAIGIAHRSWWAGRPAALRANSRSSAWR